MKLVNSIEYQRNPHDIHALACEMRAAFMCKWGKEPIAWLISAQDYLSFMELIKSQSLYGPEQYSLAWPDHFMGLPIRIKISGPIELEIPQSLVLYITKGVVK